MLKGSVPVTRLSEMNSPQTPPAPLDKHPDTPESFSRVNSQENQEESLHSIAKVEVDLERNGTKDTLSSDYSDYPTAHGDPEPLVRTAAQT